MERDNIIYIKWEYNIYKKKEKDRKRRRRRNRNVGEIK